MDKIQQKGAGFKMLGKRDGGQWGEMERAGLIKKRKWGVVGVTRIEGWHGRQERVRANGGRRNSLRKVDHRKGGTTTLIVETKEAENSTGTQHPLWPGGER